MSLRPAIRVLGILLLLLSVSMCVVLFWNAYEVYMVGSKAHYEVLYATCSSILIGLSLSCFMILWGSNQYDLLGKRESFFIVSCAWLLGGAIGALPFYFWALMSDSLDHEFASYVNCFFETVSGLSTTGASILSNIPELPRGLLFWRAFIQWLGGLGIVVLFVAVMPFLSLANKKIFRAETSDIGKAQDTPSLRDMAQTLWLIYMSFTVCQIFLMKWSDPTLSWFTCLTFGFSTTATAGFSIFNESSGGLAPLTQGIIIFFMFLSGVNYGIFYELIRGHVKPLLRNIELRAYVLTVFVASLLIAGSLYGTSYHSMMGGEVDAPSYLRRFFDSLFQVVSVHTTTGFSNANSNDWPEFAKYILILLMFIGGCSGSTGGGIKVVRFLALFKMLGSELERSFRSNVIRPCSVGGSPLSQLQKYSILTHILIVFALIAFGTFSLFFFEGGKLDLVTAFTACLASINNIGPGFSLVGVTQNYGFFSDFSKIFLAFLMVVGRLEVFTVLALFSKRFWKF